MKKKQPAKKSQDKKDVARQHQKGKKMPAVMVMIGKVGKKKC